MNSRYSTTTVVLAHYKVTMMRLSINRFIYTIIGGKMLCSKALLITSKGSHCGPQKRTSYDKNVIENL